jgi:large conductance mechanosensitive channel
MAILNTTPPIALDAVTPRAALRAAPIAYDRRARSGGQAMLEEFKKFAMRGNVVDLAVGVIIGAAFGKIVESIVGDIFMPIVGALTGGLDFSNYFIALSKAVTADTLAEARKQGAVLAWGNFVTIVINFLIVAWVLFLVVRALNRLILREAQKPAEPSRQEVLLQEIRDILASRPAKPA